MDPPLASAYLSEVATRDFRLPPVKPGAAEPGTRAKLTG